MPSPKPPSSDRVVAVGLLTQRDVDVLGVGFRRLFPLEVDGAFDDLLRELDRLERTPSPPRNPS